MWLKNLAWIHSGASSCVLQISYCSSCWPLFFAWINVVGAFFFLEWSTHFYLTMSNKGGNFGWNEYKGSHIIRMKSLLMLACAVIMSHWFITAFSRVATSCLFVERWHFVFGATSCLLVERSHFFVACACFCMPRPFFFLLHLYCCLCGLRNHLQNHLRNGLPLGLLRPSTETHTPKVVWRLEELLTNVISLLGLLGPRTEVHTPIRGMKIWRTTCEHGWSLERKPTHLKWCN